MAVLKFVFSLGPPLERHLVNVVDMNNKVVNLYEVKFM